MLSACRRNCVTQAIADRQPEICFSRENQGRCPCGMAGFRLEGPGRKLRGKKCPSRYQRVPVVNVNSFVDLSLPSLSSCFLTRHGCRLRIPTRYPHFGKCGVSVEGFSL